MIGKIDIQQSLKEIAEYSLDTEKESQTLLESLREVLACFYRNSAIPKNLPKIDFANEDSYWKWKKIVGGPDDDEDYSKSFLIEIILSSFFYDFFKKAITFYQINKRCYILNKSNGDEFYLLPMAIGFFQIDTFYFFNIEQGEIQSYYINNRMVKLLKMVNNNEWFLKFFTNYIKKMLLVSKIGKVVASLDKEDWETHLMTYGDIYNL